VETFHLLDDNYWGIQDQSSCCEGPNGESNWIECP